MSSTIANLSWKFAERISVQIVSLIISIILARILTPSDYGLVAMVTIFVTIAYVIVDGGFSGALIQKKNADDIDFSSVFYFSILFACILYTILFFTAPLITKFYGEEYKILTPLLRVLGIQIIIFAINSVQQAYVSRKMMFKNFFWASLVGTIISAIIGICMAYNGFGVWSLVFQQLSNTTINTITLYYITRKLPKAAFSYSRLQNLLNYGIKLFGGSFLTTLYQELRALIIGKIYSAKDLALYDRGKQFPALVVNNINTSIAAVLFPKMSQEQDDITKLKETTRISIRFSAYIITPIMLGLAAIAEPLVRVILTNKWIECVPLLQLFCIIYLFQPIHTANIQAIKAIGRSDIFLKLEVVKKGIELITLLLVMYHGVFAIVINMAVLTTLFTFVNAYPNKKLLKYSYKEQVLDIIPPLVMSVILYFTILGINKFLSLNDIVMVSADIIIGIAVYLILSIITKNKELQYIVSIIKTKI